MPRFFIKMAYDGTDYHGWQRQPNSLAVQQVVEEAFFTIFRKNMAILGCGRTDAGVHASCFYFHIDIEEMTDKLLFRINSVLPKSIVLDSFYSVMHDAHARFDAIQRSYTYYAHGYKSPFLNLYSSRIVELKKLQLNQLNETAKLLLEYNEFTPFCKAHSDNKTMFCKLTKCQWSYNESTKQFSLHVESDRFLRGMIRLIVGTCVLVAKGDMTIEEVKIALDNQTRLPKNWSAPPEGLFLDHVEYSYL